MKNQAFNWTAFIVLSLIWLGFGFALVYQPGILDTTWQLFRGWPLVGQALIALLTLPVVAALWIWQTGIPVWLRLIVVVGLVGVSLYLFFPLKAVKQAQSSAAG